jgi:hypothetical protein
MAGNKYLDLDETDDFGFTIESADQTELLSKHAEVEDLKDRLRALEKVFLPLLENLSKDPDKDMIKWPNRKPVLDKQIKRLKKLTKVD